MALTIDACVAQHQGDRTEQQDRVALMPHPKQGGVALAVVADGMGGHTGGTLAAQQVIHTARNNLEQFSVRTESPRSMLEASLKEAHMLIKASRFINEMGKDDPRFSGGKSDTPPDKASGSNRLAAMKAMLANKAG